MEDDAVHGLVRNLSVGTLFALGNDVDKHPEIHGDDWDDEVPSF